MQYKSRCEGLCFAYVWGEKINKEGGGMERGRAGEERGGSGAPLGAYTPAQRWGKGRPCRRGRPPGVLTHAAAARWRHGAPRRRAAGLIECPLAAAAGGVP